jgi:hypothetical protein
MTESEKTLLEAMNKLSEKMDSYDKRLTSLGSEVSKVQSQVDLSMKSIQALQKEQGYSLHQGIIRHGSQIRVGENSALRTKLIDAFHNFTVGGHFGVQATYLRIKKMLHWKGLKGDVQNFVTQCSTC